MQIDLQQVSSWPEIGGHFRFKISTLRNLACLLIRILILLTGKLLVLLTSIELLTNNGSGAGVQGMATDANMKKKAILNLQTQTCFSE